MSYSRDGSHFEDDGAQKYLVFQSMYRYVQTIANKNSILSWKSKGLPDKSIKPSTTSDFSLYPLINYFGDKVRLDFNGSCLKEIQLYTLIIAMILH